MHERGRFEVTGRLEALAIVAFSMLATYVTAWLVCYYTYVAYLGRSRIEGLGLTSPQVLQEWPGLVVNGIFIGCIAWGAWFVARHDRRVARFAVVVVSVATYSIFFFKLFTAENIRSTQALGMIYAPVFVIPAMFIARWLLRHVLPNGT